MEDEVKQPQQQNAPEASFSNRPLLQPSDIKPVDPRVAEALRQFSERGITFERDGDYQELRPNYDFDTRGMHGWVQDKTRVVDRIEDGLEDWALGRGGNPFEGANIGDIVTGLALGAIQDEIPGEQRDPFNDPCDPSNQLRSPMGNPRCR